MGQKMTWDEIKKTFPNEWVAVVNYTTDENGEIDGEVVAHYDNKDEFYKHTKEIVHQYGGMTMLYTGELIKNAETPLLWQISRTA